MANVLIAGCGYVGRALATELATGGHRVWGLRRRPVASTPGIDMIAADLADPPTLADLPALLDYVFYLVGSDTGTEDAYRSAYVDGLRNLLTALVRNRRPPRRVFLASSTAVYEQTGGEWVDESSATEPERFQGRVLLESEALVRTAPLASTVVRFAGIYGPERNRTLGALKRGELRVAPTPVFTNRIHRDDCAGFLAHIMKLDAPEATYLGVDDEPADRRLVLEWLARELGVVPPVVDQQAAPPRSNKRCRNARLRASGYRLAYPTYREGYRAIIAATAG